MTPYLEGPSLVLQAARPTDNVEALTAATMTLVRSGGIARWFEAVTEGPAAVGTYSRCHETATHYKWLLALATEPEARVWLHEFKGDLGAQTYAAVPHNHRYPFVSIMLSGSYVNESWKQAGAGVEKTHVERHGPMDVLVMEPDEVHSLSLVQPGTLTVVFEGSPLRSSSTSWSHEGRIPRRHEVMPSRRPQLLQQLSQLREEV